MQLGHGPADHRRTTDDVNPHQVEYIAQVRDILDVVDGKVRTTKSAALVIGQLGDLAAVLALFDAADLLVK